MSKIKFRGKEYDSQDAMPAHIRQAYQVSLARRNYENTEMSKSNSIMDQLSPEIKELYDRARGRVERQSDLKSSPLDNLPKTDELYNRSAQSKSNKLDSDELIYQPSPPIITQNKSALEPDRMNSLSLSRIIIGLVILAGLLAALYWVFYA